MEARFADLMELQEAAKCRRRGVVEKATSVNREGGSSASRREKRAADDMEEAPEVGGCTEFVCTVLAISCAPLKFPMGEAGVSSTGAVVLVVRSQFSSRGTSILCFIQTVGFFLHKCIHAHMHTICVWAVRGSG